MVPILIGPLQPAGINIFSTTSMLWDPLTFTSKSVCGTELVKLICTKPYYGDLENINL